MRCRKLQATLAGYYTSLSCAAAWMVQSRCSPRNRPASSTRPRFISLREGTFASLPASKSVNREPYIAEVQSKSCHYRTTMR